MIGPLWKETTRARKQRERAEMRVEVQRLRELRRRIYARDGGRCRATGKPVDLTTDNPWRLAHVHHVVFRSVGGTNDTGNLVTLCADAHDLIHRHLLTIAGNADEMLLFTRFQGNGQIARMWHSPCPSGGAHE